jgi:hypothetical protein
MTAETPRHYWTFTTRQHFFGVEHLPRPCVFDHGLWVVSSRPISRAQAERIAKEQLSWNTRITSSTPGRHQVTTRHHIGYPAGITDSYQGYAKSVAG